MRHTFLDIYNIQKNPEHAIALDDKNRHLIFEQIALFSKNANAKSGSLFSLNRLPDSLLSFSEFQLIEILKKLIYKRVYLVRSFINQPPKQTSLPAQQQDEDPYKKLEREIKKKEMGFFNSLFGPLTRSHLHNTVLHFFRYVLPCTGLCPQF